MVCTAEVPAPVAGVETGPPAPLAASWAAGVGAALALLGLLAGQPVLVLVGLVVSTWAVLRRRLAHGLALPASALVLVGAATGVGLFARALRIDALASPAGAAAAVLVWCGTMVVLAWRPRRASRPAVAADRRAAVAALPAVVAASIAVLHAFSTRAAASWGLTGTDLLQHVIGLQQVRSAGWLDYGVESYPRGLHMLAALVSAPTVPPESAAALEHDLRLFSSLSWLSFALLLLCVSLVAARLAAALRLSSRVAAAAGCAAGGALLVTNSVLSVFVVMGAVPSLLAVVALWALPVAWLELRAGPARRLGALVVAAAAVALLAHLWQALVIVPVLGLLFVLRSPRGWRSAVEMLHPRQCLAALAAVGLLAAAALPAVLGVARDRGTAIAAIAGDISQPPWLVVGATFVGTVLLSLAVRRFRPLRPLAGSALGLVLVTGLLLRGAGNGLDVTQYYPMKVVWFLFLVLLPVTALATTVAASWLARRTSVVLGRLGTAARVARVAAFASVSALVFSFVVPQIVAAPSGTLAAARPLWDTSTGARAVETLQIADEYGTRFAPRLTVPVAVGRSAVLDRSGSYIVSKLISAKTGQPQNYGRPAFVCDDVAKVAGDGDVVIITKLDPTLLKPIMERGGCGDVDVVRIPGDIADSHVFTSPVADR